MSHEAQEKQFQDWMVEAVRPFGALDTMTTNQGLNLCVVIINKALSTGKDAFESGNSKLCDQTINVVSATVNHMRGLLDDMYAAAEAGSLDLLEPSQGCQGDSSVVGPSDS